MEIAIEILEFCRWVPQYKTNIIYGVNSNFVQCAPIFSQIEHLLDKIHVSKYSRVKYRTNERGIVFLKTHKVLLCMLNKDETVVVLTGKS